MSNGTQLFSVVKVFRGDLLLGFAALLGLVAVIAFLFELILPSICIAILCVALIFVFVSVVKRSRLSSSAVGNLPVTQWESRPLSSSEEITSVLNEFCGLAQQYLLADGVKLLLFDPVSGGVTTSCAVGQPFDDTPLTSSSQILSRNLVFAGDKWGRLLVKLPPKSKPSVNSEQAMNHLAREAVIALLNAKYSEALLAIRGRSDLQLQVTTGFLANLSHEIRGPLGIILNASELVLEGLCGELNEDQTETLTMVRLNSDHLMELVTDVLDYAKLESGKMNPTRVALRLNDQLQELAKMVRAQADAKEHVIRCRDVPDSFVISSDRRHFRQMMHNLLTNAIKYTPPKGQIEIWVEEVPAGDGKGSSLRVCVRDSGVGIHPESRGKVFAPFERLDDAYSSEQSGTGLGLSLTKRLAEVNGGAIDFVSEPGSGTTFWLEFPSINPTAVIELPTLSGDLTVLANSEEVLMVGPSEEDRVLIARYLRGIGYKIHIAEDQAAATVILKRSKVAVVILGQGYQPKSGARLGDFVREAQGSRYIPILLLTRKAFLVDVERYLREEVDRCLAKPVRLEELGVACRELITGTSLH